MAPQRRRISVRNLDTRSLVLGRTDHEEAFMLRVKSLAIIGLLALATAACGDRPVDRALTGGAIGAGGGALIGAAAGNPWAGAAVGAVGGAAIGAATTPRQYSY
jgi:osmotically inducible lipoprotein OsmB